MCNMVNMVGLVKQLDGHEKSYGSTHFTISTPEEDSEIS